MPFRNPCLWLVGCSLLFSLACNRNSQEITATTTSVSSSKARNKSATALVVANNMNEESAYKDIKGNIPRLKAMLSGRFVQHNTDADPERKKYSTWYVNEGKDSIVLYTLPVGEPNRQGHWLYMYQVMTSLPNDPLYTAFVRLEEVNRDSIIATYYEQPEDFSYTLDDIIANPKDLFRNFDFEKLPLSKEDEKVWYERKTPLKFYGRGQWFPTKSKQPTREGGFDREFFLVEPHRYLFGKEGHDKDKKFLGRTNPEKFIREAMLAPDYIGY